MDHEVFATSFPAKLHRMLTDIDQANNGWERVVCWTAHGTSFVIRNKKRFLADIMPKYFYQLKYNSFARQLNLHGFRKKTQGPDKGSFYHDLFRRNEPRLALLITRSKAKSETGRGNASRPTRTQQELCAENLQDGGTNLLASSWTTTCQPTQNYVQGSSSATQPVNSGAVDASVEHRMAATMGRPPWNQQAVFSHHPSFAASSLLLSNISGNRRQNDKSCPPKQPWQQEFCLPDSLQATPACDGAFGSDTTVSQPLSALPLSELEPDPIRTSFCVVGNPEDLSGAGLSDTMTTANLVDLEPTPLAPGCIGSSKMGVSCATIPSRYPYSSNGVLEPNPFGLELASAGPTWKQQTIFQGDNDDDSCGSSLSAFFFG